MKNNWKKIKLSEITDVRDGTHDTPKPSLNGKFLITSKHIKGGKIDISSAYKISIDDYNFINKRSKVDQWDILISMIGTVGEICLVSKYPDFAIKNVGLIKTKNKHLARYLYYYLKSPIAQNDIKARLKGTTQQYLSLEEIRNFPIKLPPLETQKKIAKMLSAFDDKIELNNKINENLEQQAQAVFKEKIINQCNNRNGKIGDYCSVKSGFAFKSTWWQDKGIKVIKIKNINDDNIDIKNCSFVNKDKIPFAKEFVVKGGDLLIAMTGATIGKFAVVPKTNETLLVNQRVGKFFLGEEPINNLPFLYCTLKEKDITTEIINKGQGSAQANISGNDIMTTDCYFPNRDIIQSFNKICKPLFENIIMNNYENEQLANLRDTLLPKLMNGEIDVDKINI